MMSRITRLWRNLTAKKEVEHQLDDELRSYIDMLEAEKIESGVGPAQARREALLDIGGIEQVKEQVRDVRIGRRLEILASDFHHAWRSLWNMPLIAAVVLLSLAVGIGVNTTVFSWIQAVIFQPLPAISQSGSYQQIEARTDTGNYPGLSWPEYEDLRVRAPSFRGLLAFRMIAFYVGELGAAERTYGLLISGNYFPLLGLKPALGRFIQPEDVSRAGRESVVVISYAYWQKHFGGSPSAIGQNIRVNNHLLTVIGITPERFQGTVLGLDFSLWTPATLAPELLSGSNELEDRSQRGYAVMGLLRPGESRAAAQSQLDQFMRQLARTYPATNANIRGEVLPFWRSPHGPQRMLAMGLALLEAIMLLLLLAVCGNTATLMLARATTRQREIGVRLAMGAAPWRVITLLFTENFLLAFLGSSLGVLLAIWGTRALRAVPIISSFPIRFQSNIDALGVAFALGLGCICGMVFGAFPAVHLARIDPQTAFRPNAGTSTRSRARNLLMGTESALGLMVLIAAGLFLRSFSETRATDPGFRRDGVLLASYDLTGRNRSPAQARDFAARLLDRLRGLRGVEQVSIATSVPLDIHGMPTRSFTVEGRAVAAAAPNQALTNTVTPGYFNAIGIPILAGRDFADLTDQNAPMQAIVNQEFVRRFIGNGEAVGRRIQSRDRTYVTAGVVRNAIYESFSEKPSPMLYLSYRDRPLPNGEIHLRTRPGSEMMLVSDVQRLVRNLDPTLSIYDARTMNEHLERNAFLRRIPAQMFVVLGPLLLVLAAIGIYAVVAYSVARRVKEIGVRLALGATVHRVVMQIAGETLRVAAIGTCIGWLIAVVLDVHLNHGVLYAPVFLGVPSLLLSVAAVACWVPAYRAARLDPMLALREE
ncbi:MAG: ABC transporter permease [Alphaproteobacteria bacterium]|nr:ABC transporter permease [Alphaproteobacteria bacterium]